MDHLPRLKTAVLLLLACACLLFLLLAWETTVGSQPHTIFFPLIGNGERKTGGPHPWPHATLTPTPTRQHGGFDPLPRATLTPTPEGATSG